MQIVGMKPISATGSTPRFGWSYEAHTAIEQAVAKQLPAETDSFKRFLQTNMADINRISVEQDTKHPGPKHYTDLEELYPNGEQPFDPPNKTNYVRSFETVQKFFAPEAKARKQDEFIRQPLNTASKTRFLKSNTNGFQATMQSYNQLVDLLKEINQTPFFFSSEKQKLRTNLTKTLGELSHYAADLQQPLHLTCYASWKQKFKYPSRKSGATIKDGGAHFYLELSMPKPDDFSPMAKTASKPNHHPPRQLEHNLLNQMEKSYLSIFDLVQSDQQAQQTSQGLYEYFSQLKQAWTPILETHVRTATKTLETLLYSAYIEAGRPDVDKLAPETTVTGSLYRAARRRVSERVKQMHQ